MGKHVLQFVEQLNEHQTTFGRIKSLPNLSGSHSIDTDGSVFMHIGNCEETAKVYISIFKERSSKQVFHSFLEGFANEHEHLSYLVEEGARLADIVLPFTSWSLKQAVDTYCADEEGRLAMELKHGKIGDWDVSHVTDMMGLFFFQETFNENISKWDVSSVTEMTMMFSCAKAFNQDLSKWQTRNVLSMNSMFYDAKSFNHPVGSWNTASVTDMREMFRGAVLFNQDLSAWRVGRVTDMSRMFSGARDFNSGLSGNNYVKLPNYHCRHLNVILNFVLPTFCWNEVGTPQSWCLSSS